MANIQELGQELGKSITKEGKHTYKLVIDENLFNRLKEVADAENTTASDLIRKAVKLLLMIVNAADEPDTVFIIRRPDGTEEKIWIVM